ncbi:caspase family protein [Planktothrix sp. FACHB-1355]|uniref:Caspase family protein n=1 Tax=Aerosakkonema funiforme FACHB-1375 TaxID=2949571 RepID=A0A926VGL8_9CYAN|nr:MULTISPECIES: caspase family protein [Oscillatoriales]MBD2183407.1 caspase family protein [Aerosakkonema funiforme FACHB-1375]MBD3557656.1 caspase family protein [Planktothrix sp. FACHB-1355]
MADEIVQTPNLYALLIGIDSYMPNILPDGSRYKSLGGCVRDINHVEAFLIDERQVPKERIWKLTASISNPKEPSKPLESPEKLPTRQNMIDAFRKLKEEAPKGSQVYIHYSGHGGRAKTVFPSIKGEDGIDEGLVPTDIGTSEGQYLRDLDLRQLLKELVDKGLIVTVVLDCCHSGGATRGDVEIRGGEGIDDKPLQPGQELVAPVETLAETWRSVTEETPRGLKPSGLRAARDYVLLAACRENEFAYEYAFNRETKERNGALTYWLLDTLRQQNPGQTYNDLFERINAKIHSQFPQQTPISMGEVNRTIFGDEFAEIVHAVPVLKVEKDTETGEMQAKLGVGQVNGVAKGAEFAIYPRTVTDLKNKENRTAIATIIQRGATESLCQLKPIEGQELKIEDGDRAVLVSPSINLVRKVSLVDQEAAKDAFKAIKEALPGNGWVELAEEKVTEDDDEGVAYQLAVNDKGEYEICDRAGHPYKNIAPVKISDPDAAATIVKRLVHLTKYHATAELDNRDKGSPLAGKLILEWLGTSDSFELGDDIPPKSQLNPIPDPSNPTVKKGEYVFLSIQNTSFQDLNVAVLDIASDWSVEQIYPGKGENFITIEAGKKEVIPIPATSGGEDNVKVFATVDQANFRWLELPSLDEEIKPKGINRSGNPLDALLAAIDEEQPPTRKLSVAASPSREWTTKQINLTVTE